MQRSKEKSSISLGTEPWLTSMSDTLLTDLPSSLSKEVSFITCENKYIVLNSQKLENHSGITENPGTCPNLNAN
jgi:hypothetical protein